MAGSVAAPLPQRRMSAAHARGSAALPRSCRRRCIRWEGLRLRQPACGSRHGRWTLSSGRSWRRCGAGAWVVSCAVWPCAGWRCRRPRMCGGSHSGPQKTLFLLTSCFALAKLRRPTSICHARPLYNKAAADGDAGTWQRADPLPLGRGGGDAPAARLLAPLRGQCRRPRPALLLDAVHRIICLQALSVLDDTFPASMWTTALAQPAPAEPARSDPMEA